MALACICCVKAQYKRAREILGGKYRYYADNWNLFCRLVRLTAQPKMLFILLATPHVRGCKSLRYDSLLKRSIRGISDLAEKKCHINFDKPHGAQWQNAKTHRVLLWPKSKSLVAANMPKVPESRTFGAGEIMELYSTTCIAFDPTQLEKKHEGTTDWKEMQLYRIESRWRCLALG